MSKYIPSFLWTIISARGLYTWRRNAQRMADSLDALRANGRDKVEILFARADQLMDNLRAFAFLNGMIVGALSFFVVQQASWTLSPTFQRIYADYTLSVLIGSFFIFMLNGEIYAHILDKVRGGK